jgi:sporulation protein YlmC with PRC-barrel domain
VTAGNSAALIKISDSDQTVADPAEDIRGRKVYDRAGDELGKVDDLLIDIEQSKVRLLRVEHGGILGIGTKAFFIPVDAVTEITDDAVQINESRDRIVGAPGYDPDLIDKTDQYEPLYNYYGYQPFWGPGYVYPGYPYSRM